MAELTNEEIGDYISLHIDDFTMDLLVETEVETDNAELLPEIEADPEEMEEYLDNIIDEIDIENWKNYYKHIKHTIKDKDEKVIIRGPVFNLLCRIWNGAVF